MTSAIRDANIFSDAWKVFFAKVNSVSDPNGKSKWVYGAFPEKAIQNTSSYPLIVVSPVEPSYDPLTFRNVKRGPLRVSVDVYSTRVEELDTVSDSITNTFETNENDGSFGLSGVHSMSLISSPYSFFSRDSLRIHNRTLVYEFDYGWH